jgi:carbamoylphosphate synthase small subunit
VRACEIIAELEPETRGAYAGGVGYFAPDGSMDSCIVLRTAVVKDGVMHVQAGAGHRRRFRPRLRTARMRSQEPAPCSPPRAKPCAWPVNRALGNRRTMILVIDNYDSFTWNLVHYLMELGAEVEVVRNDAFRPRRRSTRRARAFSFRPAPARPTRPESASISSGPAPMRALPLLGVCLGHQSIGQYFGGKVRARRADARQDLAGQP